MQLTLTNAASLDSAAMNDFFNTTHGQNRPPAAWQWLFLTNPSGEAHFAVIKEDGRILGTQCLMPMRFVDRNGVFLTAKSEETLLDPSLRGEGVFELMYEPLFEWAAEQSIRSIWGFTTAIRPFVRVGFSVPGSVDQYVLPLQPRRLSRTLMVESRHSPVLVSFGASAGAAWGRLRRLPHRSVSGLESGPASVEEIADEAEDLCAEFVSTWGGCTTLRDRDYLHWRLRGNPWVRDDVIAVRHNGKLVGWAVCSLDKRGFLNLIDVLAVRKGQVTEKRILIQLMRSVVEHGCSVGASAVRAAKANAHPFTRHLEASYRATGFLHTRRGGSPIVYRATRGIELPKGAFSNMYLTRMAEQGLEG